jgi:hypothetical protein
MIRGGFGSGGLVSSVDDVDGYLFHVSCSLLLELSAGRTTHALEGSLRKGNRYPVFQRVMRAGPTQKQGRLELALKDGIRTDQAGVREMDNSFCSTRVMRRSNSIPDFAPAILR